MIRSDPNDRDFDLTDRTVTVVAAHPDDEILGCGALLATLRHVTVVHVTDGAPEGVRAARQHGFDTPGDYAQARRHEAAAALALAGVGPERITRLEFVDQQASVAMAALARRLVTVLADTDVVLTHTFEGGHPDHDAVALAVHAACRMRASPPTIIEMPFYHADADGWRRQCFLAHFAAGPEWRLDLDEARRALKRRMIGEHRTQADVLAGFDLECERFRLAPPYDFRALPHAGPLLYERHGWNLTGALWTERAAAALAELGLD